MLTRKQKIAFCFLSYGDIENMAIWQRFFADADKETYTILLHTVEPVTVSALEGVSIIPRIPTAWATYSLVEVQQRLFETAFQDEAVAKFVLLSGDTIPLYGFDTVYRRLCEDDKGYLRYLDKPLVTRAIMVEKYKIRPEHWPVGLPLAWSTTSQWITLNRSHVALMRDNFDMIRAVFDGSEIPDEHVYSVFFGGHGLMSTFHLNSEVSHLYVHWKLMGMNRPDFLRRPPNRKAVCRIRHRVKPWTYHTGEFDRRSLGMIYDSGALFLRKICKSAQLVIDWGQERVLRG